jgi:ribosome biogenesis GTPase
VERLGWDPEWARVFDARAPAGTDPARIVADWGVAYDVAGGGFEGSASAAPGTVRAARSDPLVRPTVGDFVALDRRAASWIVSAVLPRRTLFARRAAGDAPRAQPCAANVDIVLVACAFGYDLNARRIERYLALTHESGARPVVLLTKADVAGAEERAAGVAAVTAVAGGAPVLVASARTGEGLAGVRATFDGHRTVAVLGSSGVGKSTLVNALAGTAALATGPMRRGGGKGRHTTTHRELVVLASGGVVIDTPGMRELGLLDAETGLSDVFDDVTAHAARCRFADCTHAGEPGCAVRAAVDAGALDAARVDRHRALTRESRGQTAHERKRGAKVMQRALRTRLREKGRK